MKTKTHSYCLPLFANTAISVIGKFIGVVVMASALFISPKVEGVTILTNAPNATVYLGLPFPSVEFENPLAGGEMVMGRWVLEWRDADYAPGPPPWYDDWSVSDPANIDGNANEIWMRAKGQSVVTTTTVPSRVVSIHLLGDNNDGVAAVLVDGNLVARLDMNTVGASQTALIIVKGLPNANHTIEVDALGIGQGLGPDVAVLGAAALKEGDIKWNQPPVHAALTNVFLGWNETSVTNEPWASMVGIGADDWVCSSTAPVTKIRWWGSFQNWRSNSPPSYMPNSFQITIWNDFPADPADPTSFSHPGNAIWQTHCANFSWNFVGWDYDPRSNNYEACFLFEQNLTREEQFVQPGPPGTIYWISIAAEYWQGTAGPSPWGWKTRPRDPTSPAPDDAVKILLPPASIIAPQTPFIAGVPLFWPDPAHSWDLAFELISEQEVREVKWEQVPDISPNGMDVDATWNPAAPPPLLLADDFLCTSPGPLTNITIWGSWTNDVDWQGGVTFTLSIHDDIPATNSKTGYSMPGAMRWTHTFMPGQFTYSVFAGQINEWWYEPPMPGFFPGDHVCFQYDFNVSPQEAFLQEGTIKEPKVYWLDVQAQLFQAPPWCSFGWKTCPTNWNDDAVWVVNAVEPYNGPWNRLTYPLLPPPHPLAGQTVDLAFRLNAGWRTLSEVKWSQPPVPAEDVSIFNGWNEISRYGQAPILADDWACTTTNPVTDIHWWGSFLNWTEPTPPDMPDVFFISFWTDLPPGGQWPFSHPGVCLQTFICTNFTWQFAGWDWDPRNPDVPLEACFRFDQDLATNEWFHQSPEKGTNIYWISIAAVYAAGQQIEYPWGWKTRPHDTNSLAPDDAVRIYNPIAPQQETPFMVGEPIWWPDTNHSWDLAFVLTTRGAGDRDFGDTPAPTYPTLQAQNGARHFILPGFYLGSLIDAEADGLPDAAASGDDTNNLADEDGVIFTSPLLVGTQATVNVVLTSPSGSGRLDAWVDFDRNGVWGPGEKVFNNQFLLAGTNYLNFAVPNNCVLGPTFARFRLSSAGGLLPAGAAADGEVEDYPVTLVQPHPATNIVITNIVVTATNVTVEWQAETNVHYWLRATLSLSNSPPTWSDVGSEVIGPANSQTETNTGPAERYYRVVAPLLWP